MNQKVMIFKLLPLMVTYNYKYKGDIIIFYMFHNFQ